MRAATQQENLKHQSNDVIALFNAQFLAAYNTRLEGGGREPLYQPAVSCHDSHRVVFTEDYFASALHEVAHWCIAGPSRLRLEDYGYWYQPDGRSDEQQRLFEKVEVKPQALEWVFAVASCYRFRLSADNLSGAQSLTPQFKQDVYLQVLDYCRNGLPSRAAMFVRVLADFYGTSAPLKEERFTFDTL